MHTYEKNRQTLRLYPRLRKAGEVRRAVSSSFCFPNPTQSSYTAFINLKKQPSIRRLSRPCFGVSVLPTTFLRGPVKGDASCHWATACCRSWVPTTGGQSSEHLVHSSRTYHSVQCLRPPLALCLRPDLHHGCPGILESQKKQRPY